MFYMWLETLMNIDGELLTKKYGEITEQCYDYGYRSGILDRLSHRYYRDDGNFTVLKI